MEEKNNSSAPDLLPCPFCGNENVSVYHDTSSDHRYDWSFHVVCHHCDSKGESDKHPEQAAKNWNRRATQPVEPAQGERAIPFRPWSKEAEMVQSWSAVDNSAQGVGLTDAEIRGVWLGMPGGPGGWLKSFGFIQFARAIESAILARQTAPTLADAVSAYEPGKWFKARTLDEMQAFYMSRLPAIRDAAREHGYAIGLHGSTRRDFDLMAMQWRDNASDKDTLAHAIAVAACGITHDGAYQWERKPNGRFAVSMPVCWTDHANPDFDKPSVGHIDLSVIDNRAAGWDAAAAFIEKKAEEYITNYAETEHDTGATVWRYGDACSDYHSGLVELAEELRTTAADNQTKGG